MAKIFSGLKAYLNKARSAAGGKDSSSLFEALKTQERADFVHLQRMKFLSTISILDLKLCLPIFHGQSSYFLSDTDGPKMHTYGFAIGDQFVLKFKAFDHNMSFSGVDNLSTLCFTSYSLKYILDNLIDGRKPYARGQYLLGSKSENDCVLYKINMLANAKSPAFKLVPKIQISIDEERKSLTFSFDSRSTPLEACIAMFELIKNPAFDAQLYTTLYTTDGYSSIHNFVDLVDPWSAIRSIYDAIRFGDTADGRPPHRELIPLSDGDFHDMM